MALFEMRHLSAGYRDVPILRDVTIEVEQGQTVCVIGPNGAGKSTLIKSAMGLLKIFSGSITMEGRDITSLAAEKHVDAGIGYVPQVANVFASLTVRENLQLAIRDRRKSAAAMDSVFEVFPDLREKLGASAGLLSGGERQMLAFARSLINRPRLLLLDEPTAALSPILVGEVFRKITEFANSGIAILLVEQNALKALKISNRAYVLSNGTNALSGKASELLANPDIKHLYLGGHADSSDDDRKVPVQEAQP